MRQEHYELVADVDEAHWWFVGRRSIMRAVLSELTPPGQDNVVVDVGCGPGANIAALSHDYSCIGIDSSPHAIEHARTRFENVRFVNGVAPDDLGDADPDALLLMDVLEHVEHDREMLGRLISWLKPGGVILITVPADQRLWSKQDVALGHYRRYEPESLRELWSDEPVSELFLTPFNARLYPLIRAVRTASRLTGRSFGSEDSDMRVSRGIGNRTLARIFAGEAERLAALARADRSTGYRFGVSLMAALRRNDGVPSM